ncbi:MAG: DUF2723 domain-containing protein [bacterium]|nr:DUF2723 domain-containing protein [bacterium]
MKYISAILFVVIFSIYALTTSPYLQAGDSAEMATAGITKGVPHQPSYPFFVWASHALSKSNLPYFPEYLPLKRNIYEVSPKESNNILIYRIGLTSALFQALSSAFLFLLLIEISKKLKNTKMEGPTHVTVIIALSITTLYSFSGTIWLYATKPEVFALNNFFAASQIYFALKYWNNSNKTKPSYLFLAYFALALTHHQTIVLLLPFLLLIQFYKTSEATSESLMAIISRWVKYPFDKKFNKLFPYIFMGILGFIPYFVLLWILSQNKAILNWGEISSPIGLLRALIRIDYGSVLAYLANTPNNTIALDQISFFAAHLVSDISLYSVLLFIIGILVLYQTNKKVWLILVGTLFVSGPLFLMYANFSLEGEFSQATVIRFYMIPEMIVMIVIFCAAFFLYQKINNLDIFEGQYKPIKHYSQIILVASILAISISSSIKNMPHYDNLSYKYAKTAISSTESNAIIMITGDIPNMTMQYMQAVENEKKQRIIFSPGQFHLNWFQKQLRSRYPDLIVPQPLPGKRFTSPSQVIKANYGKRPIYISPEFVEIDLAIQKEYVLWPVGLLLKVETKNTDFKLEKYRKENNKIFNSISTSEFQQLRNRKYQLETPLILYYARHFYNLGAVYNSVHLYEDALREYQRAIAIDPLMSESYKAIGYIFWYTPQFPNKNAQVAVEYFNKYLQTSKTIDEQYIEVQKAIKEIIEEAKKEQKKIEDQNALDAQKNASESSEIAPEASPSPKASITDK